MVTYISCHSTWWWTNKLFTEHSCFGTFIVMKILITTNKLKKEYLQHGNHLYGCGSQGETITVLSPRIRLREIIQLHLHWSDMLNNISCQSSDRIVFPPWHDIVDVMVVLWWLCLVLLCLCSVVIVLMSRLHFADDCINTMILFYTDCTDVFTFCKIY